MNPSLHFPCRSAWLAILFAGLVAFCPARAAVTIIDSITTTPPLDSPETQDAFLATITAGTSTFSSFIAASSVTGNTGTSYVYGSGVGATDPGSLAAAVTDLNISTGGLSAGVNTVYGFSELIVPSTTFFFFGNFGGDQPVSVRGIDSGGFTITDPLALPTLASANNVASVSFTGGTTATRSIRGAVFQASDFTLLGGNDASDIAGISFGSSFFDPEDVGIAIPEASSLALGAAFLGSLLAFRRRRV